MSIARAVFPFGSRSAKKDKKGALNAYRVTDAGGVTGWQYAMPEGYQRIPYFVAGADPFTAVINQPIFWTEGEKDVETVARLGGLAFSFGWAAATVFRMAASNTSSAERS